MYTEELYNLWEATNLDNKKATFSQHWATFWSKITIFDDFSIFEGSYSRYGWSYDQTIIGRYFYDHKLHFLKYWDRSDYVKPLRPSFALEGTAWGQAGARANPRRSVLQLLVTPIFFISKQFCMKESYLETSKAFPLCINAQESCLETVRLFPLQKDKNALMHKNLTSRQ